MLKFKTFTVMSLHKKNPLGIDESDYAFLEPGSRHGPEDGYIPLGTPAGESLSGTAFEDPNVSKLFTAVKPRKLKLPKYTKEGKGHRGNRLVPGQHALFTAVVHKTEEAKTIVMHYDMDHVDYTGDNAAAAIQIQVTEPDDAEGKAEFARLEQGLRQVGQEARSIYAVGWPESDVLVNPVLVNTRQEENPEALKEDALLWQVSRANKMARGVIPADAPTTWGAEGLLAKLREELYLPAVAPAPASTPDPDPVPTPTTPDAEEEDLEELPSDLLEDVPGEQPEPQPAPQPEPAPEKPPQATTPLGQKIHHNLGRIAKKAAEDLKEQPEQRIPFINQLSEMDSALRSVEQEGSMRSVINLKAAYAEVKGAQPEIAEKILEKDVRQFTLDATPPQEKAFKTALSAIDSTFSEVGMIAASSDSPKEAFMGKLKTLRETVKEFETVGVTRESVKRLTDAFDAVGEHPEYMRNNLGTAMKDYINLAKKTRRDLFPEANPAPTPGL